MQCAVDQCGFVGSATSGTVEVLMSLDAEEIPILLANVKLSALPLYLDVVLNSCDEHGITGSHREMMELDYIQKQRNTLCYMPQQEFKKHILGKNRYFNVTCGARSRVILSELPFDPTSHYINANFMRSPLDGVSTTYITTQAPTVDTVSDFWRMVWETNSDVIVMLTRITERGVPKADPYWTENNAPLSVGRHLSVSVLSSESGHGYILRTFILQSDSGEARKIQHLHYTEWPDFGVPRDFEAFARVYAMYRDVRKESSGHIIVHCSAGLGRTGSFLAIDVLLDHLVHTIASGIQDPVVNVMSTVNQLRKQRPGSVQTKDQYAFIYAFVSYCCQHKLFGISPLN